jgi:hypothetical protein
LPGHAIRARVRVVGDIATKTKETVSDRQTT